MRASRPLASACLVFAGLFWSGTHVVGRHGAQTVAGGATIEVKGGAPGAVQAGWSSAEGGGVVIRAAAQVAPAPSASEAEVAPTPVTLAVWAGEQVSMAEMAAWSKVAQCEEGGNWAVDGASYSGGLGISRANWIAYGGLAFAPVGAMATPAEQVIVAERIQAVPPDQNGCTGSW